MGVTARTTEIGILMSSSAASNSGGPGIPLWETLSLTERVHEGRRPRKEQGHGGQGPWVLGLGAKDTIGGLNSGQRGGGTQR